MSQSRDVRAKRCQSKEMSKQDVKAKGCQSKVMSKQRDVKAKACQSKGMSKLKGVSKQRDGKSRTKASLSHLPLSDFEGCLARKLRFHILHFQIWRGVSHESFVFTSSTFTFRGRSRTKASLLHLPRSLLERSLAQKLRFHTFHFQILHESFVFTYSTFRFGGGVSHESFVFTSSTVTSE